MSITKVLKDLDEAFDAFNFSWFPSVDVRDHKSKVVIKADLPGI
jgi:HSP20 family molecular chaperone IbpA